MNPLVAVGEFAAISVVVGFGVAYAVVGLLNVRDWWTSRKQQEGRP